MARYESQDEKILRLINNSVIPAIRKKDLDYYKLVNQIFMELGVKKEKVIEHLNNFIEAGKIKEQRILTIPDEKIIDLLKEQREREKEIEKELREVGLDGRN